MPDNDKQWQIIKPITTSYESIDKIIKKIKRNDEGEVTVQSEIYCEFEVWV